MNKTEHLVNSLARSIEERCRAEAGNAIMRTSATSRAVKGAQRREADALRALNAHLKECVALVGKKKGPMPWTVAFGPARKHLLPAGVTRALRDSRIHQPQLVSLDKLLRIKGIGWKGVAAIAYRAYPPNKDQRWPELDDA